MTNMSWIKGVGRFMGKHSPELLTGLGVGLMFTSIIFAVNETPKAAKILEKKRAESKSELKKTEVVKAVWKNYIPTVCAAVGAVGCLIAANVVQNKRSAALAAAYALSETAISNYRQAVLSKLGEDKEAEIHTEAIQNQIRESRVKSTDVANVRESDELVYDAFAGRLFCSSRVKIEKAVNELNRMILSGDYASLNDFYDLIGADNSVVGDLIGWNSGQRSVDISFSAHLTADDKPCLAFRFSVPPTYEFDRVE